MSEWKDKPILTFEDLCAAVEAMRAKCERLVREIRYASNRQADDAADAVAKLKDAP